MRHALCAMREVETSMPAIASLEDLKAAQKESLIIYATCPPKSRKAGRRRMLYVYPPKPPGVGRRIPHLEGFGTVER
jgi:hypothetical protein